MKRNAILHSLLCIPNLYSLSKYAGGIYIEEKRGHIDKINNKIHK